MFSTPPARRVDTSVATHSWMERLPPRAGQSLHYGPLGSFVADRTGRLQQFDPHFARLTELWIRPARPQLSLAHLIGAHAWDMVSRPATMEWAQAATECWADSGRCLLIRVTRHRSGLHGWVEDITRRQRSETRLRFEAEHDSLTGLLNRRGLHEPMRLALQQGALQPLCIAYLDLDGFKGVNDLFGHAAGDQVLRQLASRLQDTLSPGQIAARIGGDEFVLLLPGCSIDSAQALRERLQREIAGRPFAFHDHSFSIRATIGVAAAPAGMEAEEAIAAAERACTKPDRDHAREPRGQEPSSMSESGQSRFVSQLRERFPSENFLIGAQPVIGLRSPSSAPGLEMLVRMRDASGRMLSPTQFLPLAQRNGLITRIDRWVLRSTLEWLDADSARRVGLDFCAVNLSLAALHDRRFLEDAVAIAGDHPQSAAKLCVEIRDGGPLAASSAASGFVERMRSLGASLSLDGFGGGLVSFPGLRDLRPDIIKLDGRIVRELRSSAPQRAIVRSVTELAHSLGARACAPCVESRETLSALIPLEVDLAQGFLIAAPMMLDRIPRSTPAASLIADAASRALFSGAHAPG